MVLKLYQLLSCFLLQALLAASWTLTDEERLAKARDNVRRMKYLLSEDCEEKRQGLRESVEKEDLVLLGGLLSPDLILLGSLLSPIKDTCFKDVNDPAINEIAISIAGSKNFEWVEDAFKVIMKPEGPQRLSGSTRCSCLLKGCKARNDQLFKLLRLEELEDINRHGRKILAEALYYCCRYPELSNTWKHILGLPQVKFVVQDCFEHAFEAKNITATKYLLSEYPEDIDPSKLSSRSVVKASVEMLKETPGFERMKLLEIFLAYGNHRDVERIVRSRLVGNFYLEDLVPLFKKIKISNLACLLKKFKILPRNPEKCDVLIDCLKFHPEVLQLVLKETELSPSLEDFYIVYLACKQNRHLHVKVLLKDRRVNPRHRHDEALMTAIKFGARETVELLLRDGRSDPTLYDLSALRVAACESKASTFEDQFEVFLMILLDTRMRGQIDANWIDLLRIEDGVPEIFEMLLWAARQHWTPIARTPRFVLQEIRRCDYASLEKKLRCIAFK